MVVVEVILEMVILSFFLSLFLAFFYFISFLSFFFPVSNDFSHGIVIKKVQKSVKMPFLMKEQAI